MATDVFITITVNYSILLEGGLDFEEETLRGEAVNIPTDQGGGPLSQHFISTGHLQDKRFLLSLSRDYHNN